MVVEFCYVLRLNRCPSAATWPVPGYVVFFRRGTVWVQGFWLFARQIYQIYSMVIIWCKV